MKKLSRLLITVTFLLSGAAFAGSSECPTGVDLFSLENVADHAGYITFSQDSSEVQSGQISFREFTRKGCFVDMPNIVEVEGFSLQQLIGRTMWFESRNILLEECNQDGVKKYYRKGRIAKATGMIRDIDLLLIFKNPSLCL